MRKFDYAVGDVVFTKYGRSVVTKIDRNDKHFTYFVHCDDGTDMWCPGNQMSRKPFPQKNNQPS